MQIARITVLAGVLALIVVGPAFAGSCPKHMADIDAALAKNPSLSSAQLSEVKAQRAKGEELHKAGKHADSVTELGKAKKTLGIQ
jgi:hypothetical protein